VESVKAASDIYAPLSGEVIAVNESLVDAPETLNEDAYQAGWIAKLKLSDASELEELLDASAYQATVAE
jgi:glycine cleavage system H protein